MARQVYLLGTVRYFAFTNDVTTMLTRWIM